MSQELGNVPDGEGQNTDSEANQGPIRLGIDLDTTVEGRALKSSLQSQSAQWQQQAEAERQRAEAAERRAEEAERARRFAETEKNTVVNGVSRVDPDAAKILVAEAKAAQKDAELEYLKQTIAEREEREAQVRAEQEFRQGQINWWNASAAQSGVDPSDPDIQSAIQMSVQTNNSQYAFAAIAKKVSTQQRGQQQQPENEQPDYVSPPTGGGSRISPDKRLMDDYLNKRKSLQGQPSALADLKMEYRRKGLQID